jgi:H+/Cl- antiporter ClcA
MLRLSLEMKKLLQSLLASALIGLFVAGTYFVFHNVVTELQQYIWFDIAHTDENKAAIIPTAIIGAVLLAIVLRTFKTRGHQELGHAISDYAAHGKQLNLVWLSRAFVIGLVSLVAGASLGPEAILLPISYGIGYLLAKSLRLEKPEQFGMMGVIALLAAFFNAYAAALLPLAFIAYKNTKDIKKTVLAIVLGLVTTFVSIGFLHLLHEREGYIYLDPIGEITVSPMLFGVAIIMSAVATLVPFMLDAMISPLKKFYTIIDKNWLMSAIIAGLGIGSIYVLIGPIGFFSGQTGLSELLKENSEYTSLQLLGLALGKLVVTAWSIATIYRGGVIFPQLLAGMSIALLLSGSVPNTEWLATLLLATFFGIFTGALGSLIVSAAFIISLFGLSAWPLIIAAAIGSYIVKLLFKNKFAAKSAL